jgi:tetratricopeptide (TPR) repeat protein
MYIGRAADSLVESSKALALDPNDPLLNVHQGWTYLYAGKYDQAIDQMRRAIDMNHTFFRAHLFLGRAYERKNNYRQALAEYEDAKTFEVADAVETTPILGHYYAVAGDTDKAADIVRHLEDRYKLEEVSAYDLAVVYAATNKNKAAMDYLEKAYAARSGGVLMIKAESIFDKLRQDPACASQYANLLRLMDFPGN